MISSLIYMPFGESTRRAFKVGTRSRKLGERIEKNLPKDSPTSRAAEAKFGARKMSMTLETRTRRARGRGFASKKLHQVTSLWGLGPYS